VTLPLEAPEGVLGAVTVAASGEIMVSKLLGQLKAVAAHLALCLTYVKCKNDFEVRPVLFV